MLPIRIGAPRPARLAAAAGALLLTACGPALTDREDLAAVLAQSAIPTPAAREAQGARTGTALVSAAETLPGATLTLNGRHGGRAEIDFNLVAAAVGLFGQGLLFNVHYDDYSDDGLIRLGGDLAVLANFDFVPPTEGDPSDYALTFSGKTRLSGLYSDELRAKITLTTRLYDLELREGSIRLFLDGYVEGNAQRFEFENEDVTVAWERFVEANR